MQAVMQVTTIHTRDGGQKTPHNKFQRSHLHASAAAQGDALWGVERSDNLEDMTVHKIKIKSSKKCIYSQFSWIKLDILFYCIKNIFKGNNLYIMKLLFKVQLLDHKITSCFHS